jgi:hypothetical protein
MVFARYAFGDGKFALKCHLIMGISGVGLNNSFMPGGIDLGIMPLL